MTKLEAYCFTCKKKKEIVDPLVETSKGRKHAKGTCPTCKGKLYTFLKSDTPKKGGNSRKSRHSRRSRRSKK